MDKIALYELLQAVASGKTSVDNAARILTHLDMEDIGYAHIDHHRSLRKGFPEVIYGDGKTPEQIFGIMEKMSVQEKVVLVTRIGLDCAVKIQTRFPDANYYPDARMMILQHGELPIKGKGTILVVTAGTSDIPVGKEAYLTATAMGNQVETLFDVGVAGIHRLLSHKKQIVNASVIIVVAGMEGALPSVVAGMVRVPVIAVPTSIGYGTSFGGLTALFAMLNSCSSNIAVVNIDNGFGAGYVASAINQT